MIIVKNRTLLFSNREQYLGTEYDNNTSVRTFKVPRISVDGIDIATLTFRMNTERPDGTSVDDYLEKEILDDAILLTWKIRNEVLKISGTLFINIRATNSDGTVKWSTYKAPAYSEGSGRIPEIGGDAITDLERMEALIDELFEADVARNEAEKVREATETARVEAEKLREEKVKTFDEAIRSAEENAVAAKNEADRASMYANFATPDFIIQDNRLYMNEKKTFDFAVSDNRLYIKLG